MSDYISFPIISMIANDILVIIMLGIGIILTHLNIRNKTSIKSLQLKLTETERIISETEHYKQLYQRQYILYHLTCVHEPVTLSELFPHSSHKEPAYTCILLVRHSQGFDAAGPDSKPAGSHLKNTCDTYFSGFLIYNFIQLSDEKAVIILASHEPVDKSLYALCSKVLDKLAAGDNANDCFYSCYVGRSLPGEASAQTAYETACEAFAGRHGEDCARVVMYRTKDEEEPEAIPYPLSLESALLREIRKGHTDNCCKLISDYFTGLENSGYAGLCEAFWQLIIMTRRLERHFELEPMPYDKGITALIPGISLDLMKAAMKDTMTDRIKNDIIELNEMKLLDDNKKKIVEQIVSLVDENADNPNLNVDLVADKLSLSKNYLRKVFKDVTKSNLSVYLQQVKVRQACHLLAKTDATVQDITEQLDFISNNYFFSFFKKHTGMTPIQYRLIHGCQKANSM